MSRNANATHTAQLAKKRALLENSHERACSTPGGAQKRRTQSSRRSQKERAEIKSEKATPPAAWPHLLSLPLKNIHQLIITLSLLHSHSLSLRFHHSLLLPLESTYTALNNQWLLSCSSLSSSPSPPTPVSSSFLHFSLKSKPPNLRYIFSISISPLNSSFLNKTTQFFLIPISPFCSFYFLSNFIL